MTTVVPHGLIRGIQYLTKNNYDIIEDTYMVKGLLHTIHAYKPKKEEEIVEETQESLDDLTKKDELLGYTNDNNIVIPEELKLPSQIKKYLKEVEENHEE